MPTISTLSALSFGCSWYPQVLAHSNIQAHASIHRCLFANIKLGGGLRNGWEMAPLQVLTARRVGMLAGDKALLLSEHLHKSISVDAGNTHTRTRRQTHMNALGK